MVVLDGANDNEAQLVRYLASVDAHKTPDPEFLRELEATGARLALLVRSMTAQRGALLRRDHLDKVPVSEVCQTAELQPGVFYGWQRHLFEHGAVAFGEPRKRAEASRDQQLLAENERLKAKLARMRVLRKRRFIPSSLRSSTRSLSRSR